MGGYVASVALKLSKNIKKCMVIAGFNTEADASKSQGIPGFLGFFMKIRAFLKYGKNGLWSAEKCFAETDDEVM